MQQNVLSIPMPSGPARENDWAPGFASDVGRWEISLRAALLGLGYQPGDAFIDADRMLVRDVAAQLYLDAELPTGDKPLTSGDRMWLGRLGVIPSTKE